MQTIDTAHFTDLESHEEGLAIIRAQAGEVALALSIKNDGDLEVFLSPEDCENLIKALHAAVKFASQ